MPMTKRNKAQYIAITDGTGKKRKVKIITGILKINWGMCPTCGKNNTERYPDQHHCVNSTTCQCINCRIKRKEILNPRQKYIPIY